MSLDEYFSTGPARERPIFDAVLAHLESVGPVHVEDVSVGILFTRSTTFGELRPKVRAEALWFWLPRRVDHPRIARRVQGSGTRTCHFVDLLGPEDVDDDVRAWLTEAYLGG